MAKTPSRAAASAPASSKGQPKNPQHSLTLLELLSRAERELVEMSTSTQLAALTEKELKKLSTRARTLYKKWSDQLTGQARAVKTSNRGAAETANARTAEKVGVIADALGRFESRLEELAASVVETVTGRPTPARASKKVVKKAAKKKVATKTAKKKVAKKKSSRPVTDASPRGKKAKARKAVTADAGQVVHTDRSKQRKAKAAATKTALKSDGLTTRRKQSAGSATRRKQARRDAT